MFVEWCVVVANVVALGIGVRFVSIQSFSDDVVVVVPQTFEVNCGGLGGSVRAVFGVVFGVDDVLGVVHVALVSLREGVVWVWGVAVVYALVESEQSSDRMVRSVLWAAPHLKGVAVACWAMLRSPRVEATICLFVRAS